MSLYGDGSHLHAERRTPVACGVKKGPGPFFQASSSVRLGDGNHLHRGGHLGAHLGGQYRRFVAANRGTKRRYFYRDLRRQNAAISSV